jgi:predicted nucleic acid-binding protein
MKAVFADTSFFLASLNPDDQLHERAIAVSRDVTAPRLTTGFVLQEVGNATNRAALTHDQNFEQMGYKALLR